MRGRLIYIMGASGAGKDSLIRELCRYFKDSPVTVVRRHITRPASAGGEKHIPVSPERFEELSAQGYFSLQWTGHGLRYGIAAQSDLLLERGLSLLLNGSRAAFPAAMQRYPDLLPVLVSAHPHILRTRLAARGRESGEEMEARLQRARMPVPGEDAARQWIRIDNSGALKDTALRLAHEIERALGLPENGKRHP